MNEYLTYALIVVEAYIIGGVNGALITSKYLYRRDIREYGSGNPGLTNFYRVFGKAGVLLVVIIDVAKTAGPVFIGWWLAAKFGWSGLTGRTTAGIGVVLGHCFPLFYKFKGGKAVLALGVLLFTIDWHCSVIGWGTFLVIVAATRYVSLGAVIGCLGYPAGLLLFRIGRPVDWIVAAVSCGILIARHSANINRLVHGAEHKLSLGLRGKTRGKSGVKRGEKQR
ncbi:MAG: glycerol-3-phosphate 1-O-acyltransferase PlsY [Oscillospiraceae bacterium]|jgi:glycerol-3-phosphate acyltransferase PlsY|nr:glycerol-3-phosphate 1-O-acyltransferase PlsY [Oscillospiraceae bacterium]